VSGRAPVLSTGTLVRVAIAAALTIYLLFYKTNPAAVGTALAGTDWRWIGAAVALVLADRALMALRWIWLLSPVAEGTRPRLAELMRIFFISTFMGTFLPMSVGSDAIRTWQLGEQGVPVAQGLASVLMDRILGTVSILVAAALGLWWHPELLSGPQVAVVFGCAAAASVAAFVLVYSTRAVGVAKAILAALPIGGLRGKLGRLLDALLAYRTHHAAVTTVLAASVGVQALRIIQAWCLGRSLHMGSPFDAYVAFIPIVLLLLMLPISIAGMGVAQGAFWWLFASIGGESEAAAFALSVLFVALGIVGNLPGLLLFVTGRGGTARTFARQ
jgi:uncharacterized protein (TIRG00374 family)